jgi:transcriptional regulator with GAF, ATPase, and Fis domain
VKGAFTGAIQDRTGRFELADGGTLFLDEIGEIPPRIQSKLLRVLQEGQFERVGESRTRKVDVRILAATNRDLQREAEDGRFRQDLYYRLCVFPIAIPPLRDRKEDIRPLAHHLLRQSCQRLRVPARRMTNEDLRILERYDWPGNVRELQNVIERAVIVSGAGALRFDLPSSGTPVPVATSAASGPGDEVVPDAEMKRRERANIRAALERSGGRIFGPGGAAALLGMKPTTLASRIRKMELARPDRT